MRVHLSALLPEVRSIAFAVASTAIGIACVVKPSGLRATLRRHGEAKEQRRVPADDA